MDEQIIEQTSNQSISSNDIIGLSLLIFLFIIVYLFARDDRK